MWEEAVGTSTYILTTPPNFIRSVGIDAIEFRFGMFSHYAPNTSVTVFTHHNSTTWKLLKYLFLYCFTNSSCTVNLIHFKFSLNDLKTVVIKLSKVCAELLLFDASLWSFSSCCSLHHTLLWQGYWTHIGSRVDRMREKTETGEDKGRGEHRFQQLQQRQQ